jgi:hypothetical protein
LLGGIEFMNGDNVTREASGSLLLTVAAVNNVAAANQRTKPAVDHPDRTNRTIMHFLSIPIAPAPLVARAVR